MDSVRTELNCGTHSWYQRISVGKTPPELVATSLRSEVVWSYRSTPQAEVQGGSRDVPSDLCICQMYCPSPSLLPHIQATKIDYSPDVITEAHSTVYSCHKSGANPFGVSFMWKKRIFKQHQGMPHWATILRISW